MFQIDLSLPLFLSPSALSLHNILQLNRPPPPPLLLICVVLQIVEQTFSVHHRFFCSILCPHTAIICSYSLHADSNSIHFFSNLITIILHLHLFLLFTLNNSTLNWPTGRRCSTKVANGVSCILISLYDCTTTTPIVYATVNCDQWSQRLESLITPINTYFYWLQPPLVTNQIN